MTEVGRSWEVERVVLGADGVGLGGSVSQASGSAKSNGARNMKEDGEAGAQEIVVEVLVRGSAASAHGTRRSVERVLEGWSSKLGACELNELGSLKGIWARRGVASSGDAQVGFEQLICNNFFLSALVLKYLASRLRPTTQPMRCHSTFLLLQSSNKPVRVCHCLTCTRVRFL